ncbi:MAG: ATP-binding cassette domain-containing protein [bacterium]
MDAQSNSADAPNALAEVADAHGERFVGGANRPFCLSDSDALWFVAKGAVDVFIVQRDGDGLESDFKHLLRAGEGRLLFAAAGIADADAAGRTAVLVAKGLPGSEFRRMPRRLLAAATESDDAPRSEALVAQVDAWITDVSRAVTHDIVPRPRPDRMIAPGDSAQAGAGDLVSVRHGVAWLSSAGPMAFLGTESVDDGGAVAVTYDSWVGLFDSASVRAASSRQLHDQGRLLDALARFHRLALGALLLNQRLLLADVANLQVAQSAHLRRSERRAREGLFDVLKPRREQREERGADLAAALRLVGKYEAIEFNVPPPRRGEAEREPTLAEILTASGVRCREVSLDNPKGWWRGDSGAMLAFRRRGKAPMALLPTARGYRMVDAKTGRSAQVTPARARALRPSAYFFYRPLPDDSAVPLRAMFRFALRRLWREMARFALAGMLVGLVMLMPSILLGLIIDDVLPTGNVRMLAGFAVALVLLGLLGGLLQMIQGTALMRLEARATARATTALWDRIIRLPQRFLRDFNAGELGVRAMAFHGMRDSISGIVAHAVLTVMFLLPTFALLFVYDVTLGWIGLAFGSVSLIATAIVGWRQIPYHQKLLAAARQISGDLVQLLTGIGKLRSTGSEEAAFAMWARGYRRQKQNELRIAAFNQHLIAFTAAMPLAAAAALFAAAMRDGGIQVGDFLAVYSAFMVFYAAIVLLGISFTAVAAIGPACEQVAPLLEAVPDSGASQNELPFELSGEIRLEHITFGYADDAPPVLSDVSIHARPGEFIALVGESGAGKSTVFRLALGLEKPQSGAVYYDRHDLAHLNQRSVRRRVGMVVQDASLRGGSVLDNIIGVNTERTIDDAWRAAELAAIDQDIREMPMQMFTIADDNMMIFSGGQVQRIMLASALARNPRVLFLDEATNWLDNESQAKVMGSINNLSITRIVSAHRLSTIRNADRIYVLQHGRVAQEGSFDELMATEGVFRQLVQRQMA